MLAPIMDRTELIACLPPGGRVAEIGVWNGEFSQAILDICKPKELYLIDGWGPIEDPKYDFDPAYTSMDEGERSYQGVLSRFKNEIESGQVKVIKGLSGESSKLFEDNFFDWIYIDADHSYNGVLKDLTLYSPKVKNEGFILGHDYSKGASYGFTFGVIEAVNEFIKNNKYHFLALTLREGFPSYIISKIYGTEADSLLFLMTRRTPFSFEINNFLNYQLDHQILDNGSVHVRLKEKT
jgi:hypothetical protein